MELAVVGAGVGRTGTHSLKLALEQLLDAPCHHMIEILGDPTQIPAWIDAIEGRPVDWSAMLARYRAIVDWPGGSFWREISATYPDAVVLLSVRDPEGWYRSASNTIFLTLTPLAIHKRDVFLPLDNQLYVLGWRLGIFERQGYIWKGELTPPEPFADRLPVDGIGSGRDDTRRVKCRVEHCVHEKSHPASFAANRYA